MTPRIQPLSGTTSGGRTVVIFPHAGGSPRYYAPWSREVPADIDLYGVIYPGRDQLLDAPAPEHLAGLASQCAAELTPVVRSSNSTVLFGHSMGAYVAFETARALERAAVPVAALIASGADAPHRRTDEAWHRASDVDLVGHIGALDERGGDALAIPELRAIFLPTIRDDYRLVETYRAEPTPPLSCPIHVVYGEADPEVREPGIRAWADCTGSDAQVRVFPGDHFYLTPHLSQVVAHVCGVVD